MCKDVRTKHLNKLERLPAGVRVIREILLNYTDTVINMLRIIIIDVLERRHQ